MYLSHCTQRRGIIISPYKDRVCSHCARVMPWKRRYRGGIWRSQGLFMIDEGRHIRLVIKSPHFGLILVKGAEWDPGSSREIANYKSLFCDPVLSGFFGENGLNTSLKNYPDRPFWLAKLHFNDLEYVEWGKNLRFEMNYFPVIHKEYHFPPPKGDDLFGVHYGLRLPIS